MCSSFSGLKQCCRRGGDLSGGQQQQLAIGRALVTRPKLLVLDEPTEGIQPSIIKDIGRAITYLRDTFGLTILLVEQYLDFARGLADMSRSWIVAKSFILAKPQAWTIRMYVDTSCSDGVRRRRGRMQRAEGRLALRFGMATADALERLFQEGCAKVRLPGNCRHAAEAILINTAGGLTGGDRLSTKWIRCGVRGADHAGVRADLPIDSADGLSRRRCGSALAPRLAWLPQERSCSTAAGWSGGSKSICRRTPASSRWRPSCSGAPPWARPSIAAHFTTVGASAGAANWSSPTICVAGNIPGSCEAGGADGRFALATVVRVCSGPRSVPRAGSGDYFGDDGGASAWNGKLLARLAAVNGLTLRRRLESILTLLLEGRQLAQSLADLSIRMNLTPREKDKLLIAMAAIVARKRLERSVKLNHPEAIALITDFVVEGARDGRWSPI